MDVAVLLILGMGCLFVVALALLVLYLNRNKGKGSEPSPGTGTSPGSGSDDSGETTTAVGGDSGSGVLAGTNGYVNKNGLRVLGIPGRTQFNQNNGYCGELSIQMIMLKHGVWIPQSVARDACGGEALLGSNYDRGLNGLRIKYVKMSNGGFNSYAAFAKAQLLQDRGVVHVVKLNGGDLQYDHIIPTVGVKYTKSSGYDPNDVLYVNTDYQQPNVQRKAGGYKCSAGGGRSVSQGGCVPDSINASWAVGLIGPMYLGIGPPVELYNLSRDTEPGLNSSGTTGATLRARNLQSGKKYNIYRYATGSAAPASKSAKPSGPPFKSFTASGSTYSVNVQLASNRASYFVCVAA